MRQLEASGGNRFTRSAVACLKTDLYGRDFRRWQAIAELLRVALQPLATAVFTPAWSYSRHPFASDVPLTQN